MNYRIYGLASFILGAIFGVAITERVIENKYKELAEREIESVKLQFQRKDAPFPLDKDADNIDEIAIAKQKAEQALNKPDISVYMNLLNPKERMIEEELAEAYKKDFFNNIHIIDPTEYGVDEEYGQYTMTYYADGVLVDENGDEIENVEDLIGKEALHSFGKYEDDAVHVRNDIRRCYVEILFDEDKYYDILAKRYGKEEAQEE